MLSGSFFSRIDPRMVSKAVGIALLIAAFCGGSAWTIFLNLEAISFKFLIVREVLLPAVVVAFSVTAAIILAVLALALAVAVGWQLVTIVGRFFRAAGVI